MNHSAWDNLLEEKVGTYHAIRLGFRQVKSLRQADMDLLVARRAKPYTSINALREVDVSEAALELLADADAFRSMQLDRREALWEATTKDKPLALFKGQAPTRCKR